MTRIKTLPRRSKIAGAPVLALGFRPFYLVAGIFAVFAIPLWTAAYMGIAQFDGYLSGVVWHSHEMVFGFASAVIAGFLLTAVRNWTGRPTPSGVLLAGLVALWITARVLMFSGPALAAVAFDLMFLPAVGITIAIPIWRSRNFKNLKLLLVLAMLMSANTLFHLSYLNILPHSMLSTATAMALNVIAILLTIIGGRVIPAFISGAVKSARPRHNLVVETVAVGSLVVVLVVESMKPWFPLPDSLWVTLFSLAAIAHTVRLALWEPQRTIHNPLLLMLPVAYAWLPIALALKALTQLGIVTSAAPVHALTVGAMSGLMLAMMSRSALGHTGRPLIAGPAESVAFMAIQAAAVVRVAAGLVPPELYRGTVIASGMLWTLAFGIFLVSYWPILTRPRVDGRPG